MNLLIGAVTVGLILAPLALGLFVSYRVYDTLDLTADGSFGLGAAVVAALLVQDAPPIAATAVATAAGVGAGVVTGLLHTRLLVSALLVGVLTSTALYSVNLFLMRGGNVSLTSAETVMTAAERLGRRFFGIPESVTLLGTSVSGSRVAELVLVALLAGGLATALALFLRQVAVEQLGIETVAVQDGSDQGGIVPGVAKDDGGLGLLHFEHVDEVSRLGKRVADLVPDVMDVVDGEDVAVA